jgi:general stress protein 26
MAYQYKNAKGDNYYLHNREITLKGSGKIQTIYFFSRDERAGSIEEVPSGYTVKELKTGLPVLKKR